MNFNIVKSFSDFEYFQKSYDELLPEEELKKGFWEWGLGNDGELYCRCSDFESPEEWHNADNTTCDALTIRDMKRIVKEFGHLLVFI